MRRGLCLVWDQTGLCRVLPFPTDLIPSFEHTLDGPHPHTFCLTVCARMCMHVWACVQMYVHVCTHVRELRASGVSGQRRAGRAVTEAETESSWLNRHTEGGAEGKEKALQRAEEESAGKTGLGGGGSRQRTARPGDPRVWNLGSQVGGRQGKALHTSAFYQSGQ